MADDRMKNDDLHRNMGSKEGQDYSQQTPGRTGHGGQEGGQYAGRQQGGDQFGGQKGARNLEDEEEGAGGANKTGGQNRGGQNR